MQNYKITLTDTKLSEESFAYQKCDMPNLKENQVLIRLVYLGLNAGMASRMGKKRDGANMLNPLDTPNSDAIVEIIDTNEQNCKKGDYAFIQWCPWQLYCAINIHDLVFLPKNENLILFATVLGHTGLTAYTSLKLANLNENDSIIISSAAGGVGIAATQFALAKGAQVTGIASNKRCDIIKELGANYLDRQTITTLPKHSVYHDVVGGSLLEKSIDSICIGGRIMICGNLENTFINNFNRIIHKDIKLQGFSVINHLNLREEFWNEGLKLYKNGKIKPIYNTTQGLKNAGFAFCSMFKNPNYGRQIIQID